MDLVFIDESDKKEKLCNDILCIGCAAKSASMCARCSAPYCSRDCQIKHWSVHKRTCGYSRTLDERKKLIDQLFNRVCKIIAGNVFILSAWYKKDRGYTEIEITENLIDFSQSGTHFLHMKYINLEANEYDKYSELDKCFIKFKLNDFEYESNITIKIPSSKIREKQKQPSEEWTLMYEV